MNKIQEITLKNLAKGSSLVLSELNTDYILESVDWGSVEASHSMFPYPDQIGSDITNTALLSRDIAIVGWATAKTEVELDELKAELNKFINPFQTMEVIYTDYKLTMRPSSSIKYSATFKENNEVMCRFLVSGNCYQPLFMLAVPDVVAKSVAQPVPLFPMSIPIDVGIVFGYIPAIDLENLVNYGDVSAGFLVTITVMAGGSTKPRVTNSTTGKFIELDATFLEDDIIKVSTVAGNKYLSLTRAGVTTNIFNLLTRASNLFELVSGLNALTVTAELGSSNLGIEVTYSPRFLEVQ